jgi:hypothetical protein
MFVAIMHESGEKIASGETYAECSINAMIAGVWDVAPGTSAPYCITKEEENGN